MTVQENKVTYAKEEMDMVLEELRKAHKEAEQSHQLLWAVVHSVGGEVKVPLSIWVEASANDPREVIFWDDPIEFVMHLKVNRNHEQVERD